MSGKLDFVWIGLLGHSQPSMKLGCESRNPKSLLFYSSITQKSMVATQKDSQELEETWNNLYTGYIKGDASNLVLQSLLEDEKRAKCGGVVDGC